MSQINSILEARKRRLPDVQKLFEESASYESRINNLINGIDALLADKKTIDEDCVDDLIGIRDELSSLHKNCSSINSEIVNLQKRFSRPTINIGVSGEVRVGKSTTLQRFSGLSDTQIPTGVAIPVTAVRSEIYNSEGNYASVSFRDTEAFINDYVNPHLKVINRAASSDLKASSIADFRALSLPDSLGNNVDSKSSDSLIKLREAQDSLDSFVGLLTGETKSVDLNDIRKYVAYPTGEQKDHGGLVDRSYLAVKGVEIFSQFPSLGNEPFGLIDLPGLGEIGSEAASIHTSGLENNVDQILLIMCPSGAKGFADAAIGDNIDQLRAIQPGISKRSDLIVAAINITNDNQELAATLRSDFENRINSAQLSDKIEICDFSAIDEASVQGLFSHLLSKLIKALPSMDNDVYSYVTSIGLGTIKSEIDAIEKRLSRIIVSISKSIPLEDNLLDSLSDNLSRSIIFDYDELEQETFAAIGKSNQLRKDLEQQVTSIFQDNESRIGEGLFLGKDQEWIAHAKGRSDYINFLRSDAQRIKAEIADSYRGVDVFYDEAIDALKSQVLTVFYKNTGNFKELIEKGGKPLTIDEQIDRLILELDKVTHDAEFTQCFRFIQDVSFKFSQNVFYNIYSSLELLNNPDANQKLGDRGLSSADRISIAQKDLKVMATKGNRQIRDQILAYNDQFNQFLFTCMTFFNDFLYRKDVRRFERNIRILLKDCREYIIPGEQISIDKGLQKTLKQLNETLKGSNGYSDSQSAKELSRNIEPEISSSRGNPDAKPVVVDASAPDMADRVNKEGMEKHEDFSQLKQNPDQTETVQKAKRYHGTFDQDW